MNPFWWGLGGLGIALAVVIFLWQREANSLRDTIRERERETATLQKSYDDYKLLVEQRISDNERLRADENEAALARQRELERQLGEQRARSAAASRARDEVSKELTRVLNNAPQTSVAPLDVGSRDYFRSLRERQTRASDNPPTP